jgi:predicted HD superfamily hydrolase involved in NAD metabolism
MTTNDDEFFQRARGMLEERLTEFRFLHSISVSDTAIRLAQYYNVDENEAAVAGLLHDWDKNLTDEELLERAREFGIEPTDHQEDMANLLHARTGACAVAREFPEVSSAVIQAIDRHTSAAPDMTDLDMIIYVADMIEPLRSQGNLTELRVLAGKVPLEVLFFKAYETTMSHLISRHRFIHPDSMVVWNEYVAREKLKKAPRPGKKGNA